MEDGTAQELKTNAFLRSTSPLHEDALPSRRSLVGALSPGFDTWPRAVISLS